jgi:CheY-like chemotaxis protein
MKPIVLLIEDDVAVRETLVRILDRAGFQMLAAADGEEAVRLASETMPRVIVTDFNMPRMNGVDAVRAVRRATRLLHLPALIISGVPIPEVAEAVDRLGLARLIPKPFLFADLVKSIREQCAAAS